MRYDIEQKQRTHRRVLEAAALALGQGGPAAVAVAGVMAAAGLTRGGFYAHFASREALIAAAVEQMFERTGQHLSRYTDGRDAATGVAAYIDFYLSEQHRAARERGCPMAALASDLPRLEPAARQRFVQGMQGFIELLAGKLAALGIKDARAEARATLAELVGAINLARAEEDAASAAPFLRATRSRLKRRLGLAEMAA